MSYDALRHAADSWGLVFMGIVFVVVFGWTFRRDARTAHQRAAIMIFDNEDGRDG